MPSKKVLSIFILTTALVGAIIIAFGRDKSSTAINFASNLVAGEKLNIPENPNWQNELGEVSQNTEGVQAKEEVGAGGEETATDTISKTLISNYLALKQNGSLNQESAQKLVDQTANLASQLGGEVTLETKLNIISDGGKQTMIDYGENLGNILRNNKPQEVKNELEIISSAVSSRDPSKTEELNTIIAVYEKSAEDLIEMPVPQTFVKAHLDMVNGIIGMAIALKEMRTVFSDPIKSLSSMQLYKEGLTIFIQAKQATNVFIIKNNIVYKQGSGGYYLLYGI
ncbi:MAG: hypothetical protein A3A96_03175 [Candidatus Zambryskibacteria bacterium RIFCSPLOWO2_01_FULL_39_39]|uniref:Uncharacterized protein n=1 Tax=Candidatus Zambryskibacteria bacterium RIFCSPLOWO2_01_FULL_39_39 TaxID=1802758 RepID=A0A1G2TYJ7_9BACT|nr:MAG: hypothetical protein UT00_C0008G0013 [Parcubacteria group bacterium GW2011_GWA1_38_7]OHA87660.1 MAG: hypothetical protein A2644_02565 [Candidatus Zambryskibacteria bacterium RIFCSPHIGHO2_01_FULL_39_63]OHA94404.1 MAG: hypothetical protein A3B88_01750 [Candidatus Zambryskibacteria bacterium RIFCSPHIGHO2_02_FULL_39_19]OHA98784.1 MAG: hypothetical protein A3F20_00860 [Candidatus Zambryskibacteria bacterium RIFCSPHIGHO2_12_FULL_39_21]OHB01642.1 MAG: hypothetical protein A3A96_03175 [Candidat